jgi:hypothetical protein
VRQTVEKIIDHNIFPRFFQSKRINRYRTNDFLVPVTKTETIMRKFLLISTGIVVLLFVSIFLTVIYNHSQRYVIVMDEKDNPIEGAEVYFNTGTFRLGPLLTNTNGKATMPYCYQEAFGIEVHKAEYYDGGCRVSNQWPYKVKIKILPESKYKYSKP